MVVDEGGNVTVPLLTYARKKEENATSPSELKDRGPLSLGPIST